MWWVEGGLCLCKIEEFTIIIIVSDNIKNTSTNNVDYVATIAETLYNTKIEIVESDKNFIEQTQLA